MSSANPESLPSQEANRAVQRDSLFVVGIGASAGGLEALIEFFEHVPAAADSAFVVVQHLSPDFKSVMDELLAVHTTMPIRTVSDELLLEPNHVYLIPARKNMTIEDGHLRLAEQDRSEPLHMPIDVFFHSLAEAFGERCAAIVLSGTGSDGSHGVVSVKEAGGLVLVQDLETSKFDGMPRSTILTGTADFVMRPSEMPARIVHFMTTPFLAANHDEEQFPREVLEAILTCVRENCGVDFSAYQPATVRRRIGRRMGLLGISDIEKYRELIEESVEERSLIRRELLIRVTRFFRDSEAFDLLGSELIPELVEKMQAGRPLRIWCAACATGEEAFSIAILLEEYAQSTGRQFDYEIFATDLDEDVVRIAGQGAYSEAIESDISPRRLKRFFIRGADSYRILPSIRERVIFATHNTTDDPPLTRMDLVVCRNLLIYFQPRLQAKVLSYLNFALRMEGILFLGAGESVAGAEEFKVLDPKHKLFRKVQGTRPRFSRAARDNPESTRVGTRQRSLEVDEARTLSVICESLITDHFDACLVVTQGHDIVQAFGHTDKYLRVPPGKSTLNVLKLIRADLRVVLNTALHSARTKGTDVEYRAVPLAGLEEGERVSLKVHRLESERLASLFVVAIQRPDPEKAGPGEVHQEVGLASEYMLALERELEDTKDNLQSTIEELESTNEELQSANEELMASNEELQSTNEELHSVNGELYTVNAEHHQKIVKLTGMTNDLDHLLEATDIGTIFLDERLQIRRFTPAVARTIAVLPRDVGRPLFHLSHRLVDLDFFAEVQEAFDSGVPIERNVLSDRGRWYLMRVLPYRSAVDRSSGVVITFVDITEIQESQFRIAESEQRFRELAENLDQVFWIVDAGRDRFLYVSPKFEELWGASAVQLYEDKSLWLKAVHPDDRDAVRERMRSSAVQPDDIEYRLLTGQNEVRWIRDRSFPVCDSDGRVVRRTGFAQDITALKDFERDVIRQTSDLETEANRDVLTGLLNRRGLHKVVPTEFERAGRGGGRIAAILIDVDDFKLVNDRLGHGAGDAVLEELASRLTLGLRPMDSLARIGGDEFLALLPGTRLAEGRRVAERMRAAISDRPIDFESHKVGVTASLGVSLLPEDPIGVDEIIVLTEQALSQSKGAGKNTVSDNLGSPNLPGAGPTSHDFGFIVERLLRQSVLSAVAQPIMDLDDGRVRGYELLSRGPMGEFSEPIDFFRASQDQGELTRVDLRCLEVCLEAAAGLPEGVRLHVNLFPSTLLDTPTEALLRVLRAGSGARKLGTFCVEISEQQVVGDPLALRERIDSLRQTGIVIALDDVGFGRSSLETLLVLEPDVIKLDRAFIQGLNLHPGRRSNVQRLMGFAGVLKAEVIAEGIENEEERGALVDCEVSLGQGFLWGPPTPVAVECP